MTARTATSSSSPAKHALIFGASGISGYGLLNQTQVYPDASTFSRITGTTSRPLSLEAAHLTTTYDSQRVRLVNGIDLTQSASDVADALAAQVSDIATVTHVFFTAYIETGDYASLCAVNEALLRTAITAIDGLAPHLDAVILQTGGKAYGVEFPQHVEIRPPLAEALPRISRPWADNIFYYRQCDVLAELARGKRWTWAEVRPDVIVGYAPGTNAMNAAKGVALWVLLHRAILGPGAAVPFPGTDKSWTNRHTDTSQDILARFEIHLALKMSSSESGAASKGEFGDGRAYNIADAAAPVTWSQKWPRLCAYFGMKSAGPNDPRPPGAAANGQSIDKFVAQNKHRWQEIATSASAAAAGKNADKDAVETYKWGFLHGVAVAFDFDRQYDLTRARQAGFTEEVDTAKSFETAFDRMRSANVLPSIS